MSEKEAPIFADNKVRMLVLVAALGYFVDIYDLVLFGVVRIPSLRSLGVPDEKLMETGALLLNSQMFGMLVGGILWGYWVTSGAGLQYFLALLSCTP